MSMKNELYKKRLFSVLTISLLVFSVSGIFFHTLDYTVGDDSVETEMMYESLNYQVNISDSYAITDVKAVLNNPTDETLEGSIPFYFPGDAFLTNLTLILNDEVYYADVVESSKAEKEYEEAVESGQSAALGGYRGGGLYTQKVNIEPGMNAEVTIRYEMFLNRQIHGYDYEIDLGSFTQYPDGLFHELSYDILISYSEPIEKIDISSMIDGTEKEYINPYKARIEYTGELSPGEYLLNYDVDVAGLEGNMDFYQGKNSTYFMHRMRPDVEDVGKIPKDIVFVLDKSGSMTGTKISQLKTSFKHIIDELEENERFNVITFNDEVTPYSQNMLEVNSHNKEEAKEYIDSISAGGSTNLNGATLRGIEMINNLELGYGGRAAIVVLLTDGLPTTGVTNTASIRQNMMEANTRGISLFSLGFGDNVDHNFLRAMCLENNGFSKKIYEGQDASEQIIGFYSTISTPLLRDIEVNYEGVIDSYPTEVKTLFSGSELIFVGRVKDNTDVIRSRFKAISKNGAIHVNDTWEVSPELSNSHIARFWAYRYINHLLDRIAVEGENETLIAEIVSLGTNHSFVTPYTSFLIIVDSHEDPDYVSDIQPEAGLRIDPVYDPDESTEDASSPGLPVLIILCLVLVTTFIWSRRKDRKSQGANR